MKIFFFFHRFEQNHGDSKLKSVEKYFWTQILSHLSMKKVLEKIFGSENEFFSLFTVQSNRNNNSEYVDFLNSLFCVNGGMEEEILDLTYSNFSLNI